MKDIKRLETQRFADVIKDMSKEEHDFILGMVYSSYCRQEREKENGKMRVEEK